jgi:small subunit ribosomal protein S11
MADTTTKEPPTAPVEKTPIDAAAKAAPAKRKKNKRSVPSGQVHVQATFNNTIVTFTDNNGNVLAKSSAGACGFRGSKKGTAYAAQVAAEQAAQAAKQQYGMTKAEVFIKGIGLGRDSAVRALASLDIAVENIKDVTGVAHGGVRPKKARRI